MQYMISVQYPYTRVLQLPHKFENFIGATSTSAQVEGFAQKRFAQKPFLKALHKNKLLVKFRKNLLMFRDHTETSKFWQFQKKCFFFHFECFWTLSRTCDHF